MGDRECFVRGSLLVVLKASRFFGIAPLRFVPFRNGYNASVSKFYLLYCYTLMTILTAVGIWAFFIDIQVFLDTKSLQAKMAFYRDWNLDVFIYTSNVVLCYCISKCRMTAMIRHVNIIHEITSKLEGNKKDAPEERNRKIITILYFFLTLYILKVLSSIYYEEETVNTWMCGAILIIASISMLLVELQIILINIKVHAIFHMINNKLRKIIKDEYTSYSRLVDDCIRSLSLCHVSACELVNWINKTNGLYTMWLLVSSGIFIVFNGIDISSEPKDISRQKLFIIERLMWMTTLILKAVVLVETCHPITKETRDKKVLISQLMYHVTPAAGKAMTLEVDIIFKETLLNKAEFTPLGIFTVNRSLIIAMGSYITTYLVFILQIKTE